tara:strand:+ start:801 stop:1172 length:372 start_codon:yes stop_codon:yes gene_type:complete
MFSPFRKLYKILFAALVPGKLKERNGISRLINIILYIGYRCTTVDVFVVTRQFSFKQLLVVTGCILTWLQVGAATTGGPMEAANSPENLSEPFFAVRFYYRTIGEEWRVDNLHPSGKELELVC